jgi:tRNA1(Val) A37 N6-methylase TrmN6
MADAALAAPVTRDAFLGGKVVLVQPRRGHRAGLDAALLQALVPATATGLAVDLGAGVGTVAFSVAARAAGLSAVGVERDAGLVACGHEALALAENAAFKDRVRLVAAEIDAPDTLMAQIGVAAGDADWVLMNPPFDPEGRGSRSPDARRRAAHVAEEGLLAVWTETAAGLLRPGGTLGLIHRAEALPSVLNALSRDFGDIRVLPVHPTRGAAASRILVAARWGRRTPLTILPGLVLHHDAGDSRCAWTPQADAVLRGEAELTI